VVLWWVNAGAVAVRVVVGLEVPPLGVLAGGVVLIGVVAGLVCVVGVVVVPVVCAGGVLAIDTVFVPPPHPPSSAAPAQTSTTSSVGVVGRPLGVVGRPSLMTLMIFATSGAPPRPGLLPASAVGKLKGGVVGIQNKECV
jgi:hypothetical protein